MSEDPTPGTRLGRNLERLYTGTVAGLGWLAQPLGWVADALVRDRESSATWWRANYMRPMFWMAVPLTPVWLLLIGLVIANLFDQLLMEIPVEPAERRAY